MAALEIEARMRGSFALGLLACGIAAAAVLPAGSAFATAPGKNGDIAFVHQAASGAETNLFAFGSTGQDRVQLTNTPEDDSFPYYSGDGERIVFSRSPVGDPNAGQIWVMNHDGSGQTQLTSGLDHDPAFSPDGSQIAFTRITGAPEAPAEQIWIMNADGTEQTQLTFPGANGDHAHGASFSPDGRKIVYSHFDGALGYHDVAVINVDGTGQFALTTASAATDAYQPDFSPDGRRIVFDRYNQTQDDLFVVNADGTGETQLTSGASDLDLSPVFSPSGSRVAFERDDPGFTVANITLVDSAGVNQNVTPLTANASPLQDFEPAWQPLNPPSCSLHGKTTSSSVTRLKLSVTCPNENARVTVRGSGKAPDVRQRALAAKATKFKIRAVTVRAAASASKKIKLKISRKGQKALKAALKAGKSAKAKITATAKDDLGQASKDSLKLKFQPKHA
jgi:Tol biopolymer transport system component